MLFDIGVYFIDGSVYKRDLPDAICDACNSNSENDERDELDKAGDELPYQPETDKENRNCGHDDDPAGDGTWHFFGVVRDVLFNVLSCLNQ